MTDFPDKISLPGKERLPVSADFSAKNIKKALLRHSSNNWLVRYSIPLFSGSLVFGTLFGFTYPVFLAALVTFGIGASTWVYNFFIKAMDFEKSYVKSLHERMDRITESKRINLTENLLKYNNKQGVRQLEQFQHKFDILVEVLKTKFDESQLTYSRYYSIAKEVFLSGIDNLSSVVLALKTIESIDVSYIDERLRELKKADQNNMAIKKEVDALNRSLRSKMEQQEKIRMLLAENEVALTQIDETTIAISEIKRTKDMEASIDMENSMKALEEIANRSQHYSR